MNEPPVDTLAWSPRKFGVVIAIAIVVQLGLILWFSARGPVKARVADSRPVIQLIAEAGGEWLALTDPTIFARANPSGFSDEAWLRVPAHGYLPTDKTDAPLWLTLAPERLGATFRDFVKNYTPDGFVLRSWRPPAVTAPTRLAAPVFESQLQVTGDLAVRGIVSQPKLPTWTNSDVLAPSRVHVLVDARGNPVSAVLFNSSGLKAADQSAVEMARQMRFGPDESALRNPNATPDDGLVTGWVIFSWCTAAPATNSSVNPR